MKTLRILMAAAVAAVALAGHAQQAPGRGHEGGMGRGGYGGGFARAPQGYPRGAPGAAPGYGRGGPGFGPPRYPGYGQQGFAPPPQRYAPPTNYAPPANYAPYRPAYGPPFGGAWRAQEDFVRQGVRQGQLAPLGRVIDNIQHLTPGRQLDSGLEYMGPRLVYRVRWMTAHGRRVDYFVDAASGAIISGP